MGKGNRRAIVEKLLHRDGPECFFCGKRMKDDISVEHLLSRSKGGSNHLDNLVLAHILCNSEASNRAIVDKIKMREMKIGTYKFMKQR